MERKFVIGGWNNSKSFASGDTYSAPCIAYRFVNGSTNGSWQYAEFSREWVGWQFGCWPVVATGAYTEFHFTINYARNAQTAMFSNMFLHRERFGETFTYDDDKNITSVATLSEKKSGMEYDDFDNLTGYVHPGAESTDKYMFTYGSTDAEKKQHLVLTETTPEGVKVSYEWQAGRQLKKMSKSGVTVEFAYDHNGLRTQKKVTENGVTTTTDYTLHGKLITHMTQGNDNLHFYYDANSRPAMVDFNGAKYTYVHNLQGDIVAILDTAGTIVVEYKYDAWGKPISATGSKATTLGKLNPFRYRGYVYDEETWLYYLRSRYYSPIAGRFLNADIIIGARGKLRTNNMFEYSTCNYVNRTDDSGQSARSPVHHSNGSLIIDSVLAGALFGAIVGNISWQKNRELSQAKKLLTKSTPEPGSPFFHLQKRLCPFFRLFLVM